MLARLVFSLCWSPRWETCSVQLPPPYPLLLLRRWRNLVLGTTGGFRRAEVSDRARSFSEHWDGSWSELGRAGNPKGPLSRRWVRFHSLPESKRYADTGEERAEILRRHVTVLRELGADSEPVICIGDDWLDWGWTRKLLPAAWPWRVERDDERRPTYSWVQEFGSLAEIEPLLSAVAEEEAILALTNADASWVYLPYDGGADVYTSTEAQCDELRARHSDWLSSQHEGL